MTRFPVLLTILSAAITSCGFNSLGDGSDILTPRFDDGVFSLIDCKNTKGQKGLSLEMVVHGDAIKNIRVLQGDVLFNSYMFVEASERDSEEGPFIDVQLSKKQGRETAVASWNSEQGILILRQSNKQFLSGTSCLVRNKRAWESLSGVSSVDTPLM